MWLASHQDISLGVFPQPNAYVKVASLIVAIFMSVVASGLAIAGVHNHYLSVVKGVILVGAAGVILYQHTKSWEMDCLRKSRRGKS